MRCIYGSQFIYTLHANIVSLPLERVRSGKKSNFASKVLLGREGMPPMPMDYYIIAVMFTIRRQANDVFDISITRHIP